MANKNPHPQYLFTNSLKTPSHITWRKNKRFGSLGSIHFLVGDELFEVPRVAFEAQEASPFSAAALLQAEGKGIEGSDASNPVVLEGISPTDFENLCHIMFRSIIPGARQNVTKEQWKSGLRLATRWNFSDVKEICLKGLKQEIQGDAAELIAAGFEFKVAEWFREGCLYVTEQDPGPDIHPQSLGKKIGMDVAARLFYLQSFRANNILKKQKAGGIFPCSRCHPNPVSFGQWTKPCECAWNKRENLIQLINDEFADDLKEMEYDGR
ncbi:hypothetical protein BJ165DRAFT_1489347 [Panaeolus papilionaceus]|nr:hypothetical protein BJ165DRAFT_1489347 [Panaeolus papilionaceus]